MVARQGKPNFGSLRKLLNAPRTLSSCVLWPGPARHRGPVKPHRTAKPDRDEILGRPHASACPRDAVDAVAALGTLLAGADLPDPLGSLDRDALALL